jgi:ElaB/YqjD/DUF883 family membrane-anchored ribosome-binding protein
MATRTDESDFEAMREELARVRADIAGLTDDLRSLAATTAGAAKRTAQAKGEKIREQIDSEIDELLKRGGKTIDEAKARIEERPLTAVLIALFVGFVIGRLLDRG